MKNETEYRLWFGWEGIVWTSGLPATILMCPNNWTRMDIVKALPDFHAIASWGYTGTFDEVWAELPTFNYDRLKVRN